MIVSNKLLGKIILTNLWPIARHTKLTIEKTQFMSVIMTDVPIDLGTHFINMIKKAFFNKEWSLPFRGQITRVANLTKVPLWDVKTIVTIFGKIHTIIIVKSKTMVSKKRPFANESTSY